MGRSKPKCSLKCSKCYQKYHKDPENRRVWNNVAVLGIKNAIAICECRICGHKYKTNSKAAHRILNEYFQSKKDIDDCLQIIVDSIKKTMTNEIEPYIYSEIAADVLLDLAESGLLLLRNH
jgi:hypothetical protein